MEIKNNFNLGETIKNFACPCQEWTIRYGDSPKPPEDEANLIHDCAELKVYQQKRGMRRYYVKQEN
jgi:hypothetical protein